MFFSLISLASVRSIITHCLPRVSAARRSFSQSFLISELFFVFLSCFLLLHNNTQKMMMKK